MGAGQNPKVLADKVAQGITADVLQLPDPADEKAVRKASKAVLKRLSDATLRQLDNALEWCIGGNLPESGEQPPPKPADEAESDDDADEL